MFLLIAASQIATKKSAGHKTTNPVSMMIDDVLIMTTPETANYYFAINDTGGQLLLIFLHVMSHEL